MPDPTTWKWSYQGVTFEGDHLVWFDDLGAVSFASGGASEQTFADFLASGPPVPGVPADVVDALTKAVAARADATSSERKASGDVTGDAGP